MLLREPETRFCEIRQPRCFLEAIILYMLLHFTLLLSHFCPVLPCPLKIFSLGETASPYITYLPATKNSEPGAIITVTRQLVHKFPRNLGTTSTF